MSTIEDIELIIDDEDTYREIENVIYLHPSYLPMIRCFKNSTFSSCSIRHTSIESLTSLNLVYILEKLRPNAKVDVTIAQPITVMQDFDAKQIEANAKLAGFDNVATYNTSFIDENQKKIRTIGISFVKPIKNPNAVDIVVNVTAKASSKKAKKK